MPTKVFACALLAILLSISFVSLAQSPEPQQIATDYSIPLAVSTQSDVVTLDTVTVSGVQPGPGLWRVSKGAHELWILGVLSPLPKDITWNSESVADLVVQSQEVLWAPYFIVDADAGFFRKIYLGYSMHRAEKNPDGKKLKDVLSPELYARWSEMKQRYLPGNRAIERLRPLLAADELFEAVIDQAGLEKSRIISPPIRAAIEANHVKSTRPRVTIKVTNPTAALKDARNVYLNDSVCMEATLDAIEQDLPRVVTNANAWVAGDLERISFAYLERRSNACADVFSNVEFSRKWGIPDIRSSLMSRWLEAADTALSKNTITFAVLPLQDIMGPNGYAGKLSAKGYQVETP